MIAEVTKVGLAPVGVTVKVTEHERMPGWNFVLVVDERGAVVGFETWSESGDAEVSSTWLRTVPFDDLRRVAHHAWREQLRVLAGGSDTIRPSPELSKWLRHTADAGGEDRLLFHALTARDYLRMCDRSSRPAQDLAESLYIGTRALQKRLKAAADLGVFVPIGGRRAGGHLTALGIDVLERNGEDPT